MIAKKKRGFMDGYKTYDPKTSGYGSVSQWSQRFKQRMGVEEATVVLGEDNPLSILGFTELPTMEALKKAYRKLIMQHHPDRGGKAEVAEKIIAAYSIIEDRLQKGTK